LVYNGIIAREAAIIVSEPAGMPVYSINKDPKIIVISPDQSQAVVALADAC
jgi:hypothetical protein